MWPCIAFCTPRFENYQNSQNAYLEPAHVKKELEKGKDGDVDVAVILILEKLAAEEARDEERVHWERDYLCTAIHRCHGNCLRHV